MKKISRPSQNEDDAYFWMYINKAEGENLFKSLKQSKKSLLKLINSIPKDLGNYAYDEGKWTVKTVICHMIDTERIFAYRALCISRGDQNMFPGYDENIYADKSNMQKVSLKALAKEFEQVRNSTISLFKNMEESCLDIQGTCSGLKVTPRIIGWKMAGHVVHHTEVIKDRYL